MNDDTPLSRIAPTPCSFDGCTNTAHWSLEQSAICMPHLVDCSAMNNDNEDLLFKALVSPVLLLSAETSIPTIIVYRSTIPAALCSVIDQANPSGEIEILYHTDDGQLAGSAYYERVTTSNDGNSMQFLQGTENGLTRGLSETYNTYVRRMAQHKYEETCYYAEPW